MINIRSGIGDLTILSDPLPLCPFLSPFFVTPSFLPLSDVIFECPLRVLMIGSVTNCFDGAFLLTFNYFNKKLNLGCLAEFLIRLLSTTEPNSFVCENFLLRISPTLSLAQFLKNLFLAFHIVKTCARDEVGISKSLEFEKFYNNIAKYGPLETVNIHS